MRMGSCPEFPCLRMHLAVRRAGPWMQRAGPMPAPGEGVGCAPARGVAAADVPDVVLDPGSAPPLDGFAIHGGLQGQNQVDPVQLVQFG